MGPIPFLTRLAHKYRCAFQFPDASDVGNCPDGHQAILFRIAHNLTGAAGHGSPAQRVPGSAVQFPVASSNGYWGIGHGLLSFLLRFAHKNLSTRDPASLINIAAAFNSRTRVMQITRLAAPI